MAATETLAALAEGLITEVEAVDQLMVDDLSEVHKQVAAEQFVHAEPTRFALHGPISKA